MVAVRILLGGATQHITNPDNIRVGCGGWHTEYETVQTGTELVWQEEQGHWERYGY